MAGKSGSQLQPNQKGTPVHAFHKYTELLTESLKYLGTKADSGIDPEEEAVFRTLFSDLKVVLSGIPGIGTKKFSSYEASVRMEDSFVTWSQIQGSLKEDAEIRRNAHTAICNWRWKMRKRARKQFHIINTGSDLALWQSLFDSARATLETAPKTLESLLKICEKLISKIS